METKLEKIELSQKLQHLDPRTVKAFIGFDGFVDEVIHVVETRYSESEYDRLQLMEDFGSKIVGSAGLSRNFEFVSVQRKAGGNGPNMASSLISCGCELTYVGALGLPQVDSVFDTISKKAKQVISISDPGFTEAIEFLDGKLICSRLEPLNAVNAQNIDRLIGKEKLAQLMQENTIIGIENWTLVNHMTEVWQYILNEVLPLVKNADDKTLFFDLCDPEKRSNEDILTALETINQFSEYYQVTLGLNEKETFEMAAVLGKTEEQIKKCPLEELGLFVKEKMNIKTLVVHPTRGAYSIEEGELDYIAGPYCENPRLTTGAGDNFNAGFALGKALCLTNRESLLLGAASSGFYVRNCRSATYEELIDFLVAWDNQTLD